MTAQASLCALHHLCRFMACKVLLLTGPGYVRVRVMCNTNVFRLVTCAAILAFAAASSCAVAAEGATCAVRVAGPQGQAGAKLGHVDANGKCVSKVVRKTAQDGGLQASAQCRDLSYSYSQRRNSACIKHGGVLEWLAQQ